MLLVPPGFDLTSAGQLVQIPRKPQDMVSEDGLEKVMMQVLASPQNVDAHVKALFDLAAAAEDGSLREAPMPLRRARHQRTLSNSLRARPVSLPKRFISNSSPCTDTHHLAANASPLRISSRLTRDGLAWPALWTWGDGPGFFVLALLCYCLILPFCILEVVAETYLAASICIPKQ